MSHQLSLLADPTEAPAGAADQRPTAGRPTRKLTFDKLSQWAHEQIPWIASKCHADRSSAQFLFMQAVKLGEEVGELHSELLASAQVQRSDKQCRHSQDTLGGEFADVLLCVAILAQVSGVDLDAALKEKMDVIERRKNRSAVSRVIPQN